MLEDFMKNILIVSILLITSACAPNYNQNARFDPCFGSALSIQPGAYQQCQIQQLQMQQMRMQAQQSSVGNIFGSMFAGGLNGTVDDQQRYLQNQNR
jgi:hypothetical protein